MTKLRQLRVNSPESLPPLYCAFSATAEERRLGCSEKGGTEPKPKKLSVDEVDTSRPLSNCVSVTRRFRHDTVLING